jgi:2-methylcitrate dehydratase PrpD
LRYTCATALLRKSVKQEHFTPQAITNSQVNQLIGKIKLAALPEKARPGFEVRVKLKDGRELAEFASTGKGDPIDSPLSNEEIITKYRSQVAFSKTVSENSAEKLLTALKRLDEVNNIRPLVELAVRK